MEERNDMEFTNEGMEGSMEAERHGDMAIKVDGPKGGKGWKVGAICALIAVIGLGAALTFSMMSMYDANREVDNIRATLDVRTEELNKFRKATGAESADEVVMGSAEVDFSPISKLVPNDSLMVLDGSYVKNNGDFQIAVLVMASSAEQDNGYRAFLFRALGNEEWKYSSFSGNGTTSCDDVTDEETKAFESVVECVE